MTAATKLEVGVEKALDIIYGIDPDFEAVETKQVSTGRWVKAMRAVVKRVSDGKLFMVHYSSGLTECQETDPFGDCEKIEFTEVEAFQPIVTDYRPVTKPG